MYNHIIVKISMSDDRGINYVTRFYIIDFEKLVNLCVFDVIMQVLDSE